MHFFHVLRPSVTYVSFSQQPLAFNILKFMCTPKIYGSSTYQKHILIHWRGSCNEPFKAVDNKWYKCNGIATSKMIQLPKKRIWARKTDFRGEVWKDMVLGHAYIYSYGPCHKNWYIYNKFKYQDWHHLD